MTSDWDLLQRYVRTKDASAFAELVERHVAVVYGRARRILGHDVHEAEDVTQAVFIVLSQKAKRLGKVDSLAGWLYRATGYCCANAQKRERRRRQRERRVAVDVNAVAETEGTRKVEASAVLDEGLQHLRAPEREAILLRYFENLTAAQSAIAVGASAEAVEKRLQRGIDKLRKFFVRRGYAINVAGVEQVLAAEGAQQVPAGLAGKVAGGVAMKVGAAAGIAKNTATWMGWMRVKVAGAMLGGAGIVAGLGMGIHSLRRAGARPVLVAAPVAVRASAPTVLRGDPPVVTTIPAHITKEQLTALAEKRAADIKDLAVEYDYVPPVGTVSDVIRFHYKVAMKGGKLYIDEAHGTGQDASKFRDFTAFNGTQWAALQGFESMAVIDKAPLNPVELRDMGWFELAMIASPAEAFYGTRDASLVTLLHSRGCLVHLNYQDIDGHHCIVVDDVGLGGLECRVWLDAQRGLLPLRWSWWGNGEELIVFRTLDAAEVGGMWWPTLGERRAMDVHIMQLRVRGQGTDHLGLRVNQGIPDDVFELANHFPPNTTVTNELTHTSTMAKRWGRRSRFDPGLPGE